MSNRSKLTAVVLASIAMMGVAGPAAATDLRETGVAAEVDSCLAEVRDRVDYTDAARIRHEVTDIERRRVGYALKIDTAIYDAAGQDAIRAYATECVVNGHHKPMKFSFSETS